MAQEVLMLVTIAIIGFLAGSIVTWQLRQMDREPRLWDTTKSHEVPRSAQATAPQPPPQEGGGSTASASRPSPNRRSSAPAGILRITRGLGVGRTHLIRSSETITLGRGDDVDVRIIEQGVSRLHAQITHSTDPTATNEFAIIDYSRNGTFLNGRRVNAVSSLQSGDIIQVGTTVLQFQRVRMRQQGQASAIAAG